MTLPHIREQSDDTNPLPSSSFAETDKHTRDQFAGYEISIADHRGFVFSSYANGRGDIHIEYVCEDGRKRAATADAIVRVHDEDITKGVSASRLTGTYRTRVFARRCEATVKCVYDNEAVVSYTSDKLSDTTITVAALVAFVKSGHYRRV